MTLKIKILEYSKIPVERFSPWSQGETEGVLSKRDFFSAWGVTVGCLIYPARKIQTSTLAKKLQPKNLYG